VVVGIVMGAGVGVGAEVAGVGVVTRGAQDPRAPRVGGTTQVGVGVEVVEVGGVGGGTVRRGGAGSHLRRSYTPLRAA
jgi:hypothetical protein